MGQTAPSITIALPTYEAGNSLVVTLRSIYAQTAIKNVKEVLVVVDGNRLAPEIREAIRHPLLRILEVAKRAGQSARINDIFRETKTEFLVLTNDDVQLAPNAVEELYTAYRTTHADIITCDVRPLPAETRLQNILAVGYHLTRFIYQRWNNTHNYLSCNGRLVALSRRGYTGLNIPSHIWNNDAYMFFEVLGRGGSHYHADDAVVTYRLPTSFVEHRKQSVKFLQSEQELKPLFGEHTDDQYTVPPDIRFAALREQLTQNTINTVAYIMITIGTRIYGYCSPPKPRAGYWETDISTKQVNI